MHEYPYIDTPRIGVLGLLKDSNWICSREYLLYRVLIMGFFLLYIAFRGYYHVKASWEYFHVGEESENPNWFDAASELLNLSNFVVYAHTLIACRIGLDKIYIIHIIIYFPIIQASLLSLVAGGTYNHFERLHSEQRYFEAVSNFCILFNLICYIVWNIPTRILFVQQYRRAIQNSEAPYSYIFQRLLIPWTVFIIVAVCIRIPQVILIYLGSNNKWFTPSGLWFGYYGFECLLDSARWAYEIFMYFALSDQKYKFKYLLAESTTFERIYLLGVILFIAFALTFIIMQSLNIEVESGIKPAYIYLWFVVIAFQEFVNGLRYIALWYYALKEWNVNDLSTNQLEDELENQFGDQQTSTMTFFSKN